MIALLLLAGTLLDEPFDDVAALDRWTRMEGARSGNGPESHASLDGGALLLEGTPDGGRWTALTRSVDVPAGWVRISARMRTEDVAATSRFLNCDLFFRLAGGPIQATRVLTGTNDWATVARRMEVPAGSLQIGCFLSMPGRAWFDDVCVETVDPPALLGEGLAVYLSGAWQNRPVREAAAAVEWIAPSEILDTRAFRSRPDMQTYPLAGAFVDWVVTTRDRETLRRLYATDGGAAAMTEVLGMPPDRVDAEFRRFVSAGR